MPIAPCAALLYQLPFVIAFLAALAVLFLWLVHRRKIRRRGSLAVVRAKRKHKNWFKTAVVVTTVIVYNKVTTLWYRAPCGACG